MNNADVQEMLFLAIQAKESGFPRIQADPADIIEVFDQRNQLLEALEWYVENDDVNEGQEGNEFWEDGLNRARTIISRAKGESK